MFLLFFLLLFNGASNDEPFTSIYRFFGLLQSLEGDQWSCAMCPWPHWFLVENLGKHSDHQNVVVFLMIFSWVHHV